MDTSLEQMINDCIVDEFNRRKSDDSWDIIGFNFKFSPLFFHVGIDSAIILDGIDSPHTDVRIMTSESDFHRILQVWVSNPMKENIKTTGEEYPVVNYLLCSDGVNHKIKSGKMVFVEDEA